MHDIANLFAELLGFLGINFRLEIAFDVTAILLELLSGLFDPASLFSIFVLRL